MNTLEEWVANSPGHVDGNAKMPMALQTQCNGRVKISGRMLGAWCTTARPVGDLSRPYDTLYITLKSSALKRERAAKGMDDRR
jgi:hypothetical protein